MKSPLLRRGAVLLLTLLAGVGLMLGLTACDTASGGESGPRMIVLGVDGMDYGLSRQLIDEGVLPNFARLEKMGQFRPLETSAPPLSPVAWSNFITGMDSGGHGIFDFIHRDPKTMIPYLSTSRQLDDGTYELLRRGTPFWEVLEEGGVETTIIRMPANFPVTETATREISGMGTPDVLGNYRTFSFYTSELFLEDRDIGGGDIYPLDLWGDLAEGILYGPADPDGEKFQQPFKIFRDSKEEVAKLLVGDDAFILQPEEWSDWVPFEFSHGLTVKVPVIARFYLRSLQPEVELYVTPLNFDPVDPLIPLAHPVEFAEELAESGRYYTQGMPEDTKALSEGVLTVDEFLSQAKIAGIELAEQYHHVLDDFENGLLFYYFGNLDQVCHMMWGSTDPTHPGYSEEEDGPYRDVVVELYKNADRIVGHTLDNMGDDTTLVVMSDHGFASWKRELHLNTWLLEEGYLAVKDPDLANAPGLFQNVDWSKTKAYGLGLNGLYINLRGREKNGIVRAADRDALMKEIGDKLLALVDPDTGKSAVTKAYLREEFFKDRGNIEHGPDIVVGYAKEYKSSDESALGDLLPILFDNNMGAWTGDHGMDHTTVPGVYFSNRVLKKEATSLTNLAAAILAEFGIDEFPVRE